VSTAPLAERLTPCGPVVDRAAADRVRRVLTEAAESGGWSAALAAAWLALAPVFAAAPYLAGLARRRPESLARALGGDPDVTLATILQDCGGAAGEDATRTLRLAKADAHLLVALADLGGAWSLEQVTGALTRLADAAVAAALRVAADEERRRGRLVGEGGPNTGPVPGFFLLALGKHGAGELNYSSDIDVTAFYEPEALPLAGHVEPRAFASRFTHAVAALLQDRTADGYVFRVDLRLRPDPSSTPPAAPVEAALEYYETVGQNWERAAFIKARVCAGDRPRGEAFLAQLQPFVWRRSLDFTAVEDVKSIKRQIHAARGGEATVAAGADLKLGRGGIREIEFYVQTQQLILGGRDPSLRSPRTREALAALAAAGQVSPAAARALDAAYVRLRLLEHRVQMLHDEQTHRLPVQDSERRRVAALAGARGLKRFDASVSVMLRRVNRRYGELFADAEPLSSSAGSLVFTGVEDDPETLETLRRLGFEQPEAASATIRSWHHGRIGATRSERGRELFTRLAPRVLEAAAATGAADAAFRRFVDFFAGLSSGVSVQALLLANPELLSLLVEVLAYAPKLATTLSRHPATLDALLDDGFFRPLSESGEPLRALTASATKAEGFEDAMNAVRRAHREQAFRIGVHVLTGRAGAGEAGAAWADLADACVRALARASLREVARLAGALAEGRVAVVALGKAGSRELTASSDLDLMVAYDAPAQAVSGGKGWAADTYYGRFCQRLVAALSTPTTEGGLYDVDLRLRPSGGKGPVAVPLSGLRSYYAAEAETWELMALTRARVVWAEPSAFGEAVAVAVRDARGRSIPADRLPRDVREMRALIGAERPATGTWDLKLSDGGLVDVEFAAQHLQLANPGGPAAATLGTVAAIEAAREAGRVDPAAAEALIAAWTLQQSLSQLLTVALPEGSDPSGEPKRLQALLARAGGARDWPRLLRRLAAVRRRAHAAFLKVTAATEPAASRVEGKRRAHRRGQTT